MGKGLSCEPTVKIARHTVTSMKTFEDLYFNRGGG